MINLKLISSYVRGQLRNAEIYQQASFSKQIYYSYALCYAETVRLNWTTINLNASFILKTLLNKCTSIVIEEESLCLSQNKARNVYVEKGTYF